MFRNRKYFSIILIVTVFAFFIGGCGLFRKSPKKTTASPPKATVEQKKASVQKKVAEQKGKKKSVIEPAKKSGEELKKEQELVKELKKDLKEEKPEKRKITIGETTKAYIVANYGKPNKLFWSKDAEEILIYNRISEIGDNVLIFLNNKGIVKNILVQPK